MQHYDQVSLNPYLTTFAVQRFFAKFFWPVYQEFMEFVEIWERSLAEALASDVIKKLGHTESKLHLFYEHVEQKLSVLQKEVKHSLRWFRCLSQS